jgi:hypothetical protein
MSGMPATKSGDQDTSYGGCVMSREAANAIVQVMIRHLDEHGELLRTI